MTVEQFYVEIGGNYEEVLSRLCKKERIAKYLHKFGASDESSNLDQMLNDKNYEEAFRCVHSIKGMSLNLGLVGLQKISSDLCEELRNGAPVNDVTDMVITLKNQYKFTLDAIAKVDMEGQNEF